MPDPNADGAVSVGGTVRAPSPERRAAAVLHPVAHSMGLVLTTVDTGVDFSFRVAADGPLFELAGWGYAGPVPDLGDYANAPPNPLVVHTVLIDTDGGHVTIEAFVTLREWVEQHIARYSDCRTWVAQGSDPALVVWAGAGCPEPHLVAVPTEAELAAADVVE